MVDITASQKEVYEVLKQYGPLPDVALVPLAQHLVHTPQSSSGIRSRRAELERKGFVVEVDQITTASGRKAGVFQVVGR